MTAIVTYFGLNEADEFDGAALGVLTTVLAGDPLNGATAVARRGMIGTWRDHARSLDGTQRRLRRRRFSP
ncbi:MAG: hypothetical protein WKF58_02360 [Ilumatobacteraceae bacterium]